MRGRELALVRGLVATRPTIAIAAAAILSVCSSSSGSISITRWGACPLARNQEAKSDKMTMPQMLVQMFMGTLPR
jgi:hypothetical protein